MTKNLYKDFVLSLYPNAECILTDDFIYLLKMYLPNKFIIIDNDASKQHLSYARQTKEQAWKCAADIIHNNILDIMQK
jgi:hypothetical protein